MPVLFVYTERGEGKTRVPFTSKISNQIAIYLNCTVNGNDFFSFFFVLQIPVWRGSEQSGRDVFWPGKRGNP